MMMRHTAKQSMILFVIIQLFGSFRVKVTATNSSSSSRSQFYSLSYNKRPKRESYSIKNSLFPSDLQKGYPVSRNAIIVLLPEISADVAVNLIQNVDFYIENYDADMLLFHSGYPFTHLIREIRSKARRNVHFINIDSSFSRIPSHTGFNPYNDDPNWWKRGKWSYNNMIRFWFTDIFHIPIMKTVEYFIRMDDDSRFYSKATNIFSLMREKKAVYMANEVLVEQNKYLREGNAVLRRHTIEYANSINATCKGVRGDCYPRSEARWRCSFPSSDTVLMYYNNFEVVSTAFFLGNEVQNWTDFIMQTGGIYKYRWGDAPLRFITLALFAKEDQLLHRRKLGIDYKHASQQLQGSSIKKSSSLSAAGHRISQFWHDTLTVLTPKAYGEEGCRGGLCSEFLCDSSP